MASASPAAPAATAHFRRLKSRAFDRRYLWEHRADGLDYLHCGEWQTQFAGWLADVFALRGLPTLDVGTACGSLARGFAQVGCLAWGVDCGEELIAAGRQRFTADRSSPTPHQFCRLLVADAANLHNVPDGRFALVTAIQTAEHWRPFAVPAIVEELKRVTAPGGWCFLILDTTELAERTGRDLRAEDPTHQTIWPLAAWLEAFEADGWIDAKPQWIDQLAAHPRSMLRENDWDWLLLRAPGQTDWEQVRLQWEPAFGYWTRTAWAEQDRHVLREVIDQDCYRLRGRPLDKHRWIVDVGAHIGAFAGSIHRRDPTTHVTCVEANPKNLLALEVNCGHFADIRWAALWYDAAPPILLDTLHAGGLSTGGSQVRGRAEALRAVEQWENRQEYRPLDFRLPALRLEDLLDEAFGPIDLLKLDCEGGEWPLLEHPERLQKVRSIVGEYHGEQRHQEEAGERRFERALIGLTALGRKVKKFRGGDIGLFEVS